MTLVPALPAHDTGGRAGSREAAEAAGRALAAQVTAPPATAATATATAPADNPVEALARAAVPRLREVGVIAEIVRARGDCLVVRSGAADPLAVAEACALVGAWLEALPGVACGVAGSVAESTCATRGHRMCMHTLMWQAPAGGPAAPAATGRPAPLGRPDPLRPPGLPSPPGPLPLGPLPLGPLPPLGPLVGGPPRAGLPSIEAPPPAEQPSPAGPVLPEPAPGGASPLPIPAASGLAPATSPAAPAAPPPSPSPSPPATPQPRRAPARYEPALSGTAATGPGITTYSGPAPSHAARAPEPRVRLPRLRLGRGGAPFARAPWVRRRAWLLVVGLLAGALGGGVAAAHGGSSYAATAVLEVEASTATSAVSSADGAEELAVTYAALIPTDDALLAQVGADLGVGASAVSHSLSVEAVSGTALIDVRFSASSPAAAVEGADDVVGKLTADVPPGRAITPGSVSLVSTAGTAARQGSLHKYGLPIGVLLGLLVGAGAALVAERTDRRVDDVDGLSAAAGCSATSEPGGISPAELAAALSGSGERAVVFVPLGAQEEPAAAAIGVRVAQAWRARPAGPDRDGGAPTGPRGHALVQADVGNAPSVTVGAPFSRSPQASSAQGGTTVLVVAAGQRASAVREAAERLRLLCRGPAWAVLVPRAGRHGPEDHGA